VSSLGAGSEESARYYRPMARGLPPDVAQLFEACLAEVRKVWPGMR
jgi:hypothetical protein